MANAVRCEACSSHADRPPQADMLGRWPNTLPEGWVRVMGTGSRSDLASDFEGEYCSWSCAAIDLARHAASAPRGGDLKAAS